MSWKCNWFGCAFLKVKDFDSKGLYFMEACQRCSASKVQFVREGVSRVHSKSAMKIVKKCIDDPSFVIKCVRYRRYAAIKNIKDPGKQKMELLCFYDEYGLKEGDYVPDPILMFELGRWFEDKGAEVKPKRKKKEKPDSPAPSVQEAEPPLKIEYHLKENDSATPSEGIPNDVRTRRKPLMKRLDELSLVELNNLLEKCVNKEDYEKAAVIKSEIDRRMEKLK